MEVIEYAPRTGQSFSLPWQETTIIPVADVQLGSRGVDIERFRRMIRWANEQNRNGHPNYFLGLGDYGDLASPSNREAIRGARLYDSVRGALEDRATQIKDEFLREVRGTEGRWITLLHGHHFYEYADGSTTDTKIAEALGAQYGGTCAFVRLVFEHPTHHRKLYYTIWMHHGRGSGMSPGAPINTLYKVMNHFEADAYLMAHMTKKAVAPAPRLYMEADGKIRDHKKILAGVGGYSLGYEQGGMNLAGRPEGTYVEQGLMAPVSLGGILLKIRPVFGGDNTRDRLDVNVEV